MVQRRFFVISALVLAGAALLAAEPLLAEARDHDSVRHAVESGEIQPLADILNAVQGKLPGEIAGIEIEQKGGHWVYEFRVVDDQGRLFDVYVDAHSGAIERVKEK
jgi:uncharacterized membrane protein YkoI